jgi:Sideroflexins
MIDNALTTTHCFALIAGMRSGPVSIAMISASSTPALLFWSWVNQSQNALVNVYNAAGDGLDPTTLAKSYAGAVSAALLVSYGLATFVQRRYPVATARRLLRYVAFPSAMVASSLNCYIVRSPEMVTGIPVYDRQSGETVGISQVAAARGVYTTTASRAMLQLPVYFLPPALLSLLPLSPSMVLPATTFFLLVAFGIGLPAAIAVFPQECAIDVKELEPELQQLVDPHTNEPYRTLYFNKGL